MKKLSYILLLAFLGFLGKLSLAPNFSSDHSTTIKEKQVEAAKTYSNAFKFVHSKVSREKQPKKPKCIPVIVPNLLSHTFNEFCRYSEYIVHEVKGSYTLFLHYSHGKRGPPSFIS